MGQFSFMYADRNNMENVTHMEEAYVLLPNGQKSICASYDLYGCFGRYDIHDVVVDMNRDHITEGMLSSLRSNPRRMEHISAKLISEGKSDEEIKEALSREGYEGAELSEWKRNLGITIACYDEDNAALTYPIKIAKSPVPYDSVPASKSDPTQGCEKIAFDVKETLEKTVISFIKFEDELHCGAWAKTPEEIIRDDLDNICRHLNYLGYFDTWKSSNRMTPWQDLSRYEKDLFRAVDLFEDIYPYRIKVQSDEAKYIFGSECEKWNLKEPSRNETIRKAIDGRYPAEEVTKKLAWESFVGKKMSFPEYEIADKWLKSNVLPQYRDLPGDAFPLTKRNAASITGQDYPAILKSVQMEIDKEQQSRGYPLQKERLHFSPIKRAKR